MEDDPLCPFCCAALHPDASVCPGCLAEAGVHHDRTSGRLYDRAEATVLAQNYALSGVALLIVGVPVLLSTLAEARLREAAVSLAVVLACGALVRAALFWRRARAPLRWYRRV